MLELSSRQFHLLRILCDNAHPISGNLLSSLLGVSERTLRYEVGNINQVIGRTFILADKSGYSIDRRNTNKELLQKVLITDAIQLDKQIGFQLVEKSEISVFDLAIDLCVSESTIFNTLNRVNERIKPYGLEIQRHGDNLKMIGKEGSRRLLLSHYLFQETGSLATDLFYFGNYFTSLTLDYMRKMIIEVLEEMHLFLDDIFLKNIIINIAICLERIADGYSLAEVPNFDVDDDDYTIIFLKKVCERVEKDLDIKVSKEEFSHMLMLITGSFKSISSSNQEYLDSHRDFVETIRHILDKTCKKFEISLDYSRFFDQFVLHVHYLIQRAKAGSYFKNDISSSLSYSHPLIYDISIYIASQLQKSFDVKLANDEIGLIAIYIGSVLSSETNYKPLRIVIICPKYNQLRETVARTLMDGLGDRIQIIGYVSDIKELNDTNYDLILNASGDNNLVMPSIDISPLVTRHEIRRIEHACVNYIKLQKCSEIQSILQNYFEKDLFFYNEKYQTGPEILEFLEAKLLPKKYISNKFMQSVKSREELSSTAFFERFALPHALDALANNNKVIYYYSEKPIDWYGTNVNLVVLLIANNHGPEFQKIYNMLFDILLNSNHFFDMIKCKNFDELIEFLSNQPNW